MSSKFAERKERIEEKTKLNDALENATTEAEYQTALENIVKYNEENPDSIIWTPHQADKLPKEVIIPDANESFVPDANVPSGFSIGPSVFLLIVGLLVIVLMRKLAQFIGKKRLLKKKVDEKVAEHATAFNQRVIDLQDDNDDLHNENEDLKKQIEDLENQIFN